MRWIITISLLLSSSVMASNWNQVAGEWEQYRLNESQMNWFSTVRSKNGIPCCRLSDGHPTEMKRSVSAEGVNEFWIPNPKNTSGPWLKVPEAAYTVPGNNPVGVATVWYSEDALRRSVNIRCFVPESET